MKAFAELVQTLSRRTGTNDKLAALRHYFSTAGEADKIWVLALFTGKRPRRTVTSTQLREWCMEVSGLPAWLFEECYHTVGDLGETIALLLPEQSASAEDLPLHYWMNELMQLETADERAKKQRILQAWRQLQSHERFVFNKLITGGFRIGVSRKTVINALAAVYEVEPARMAHLVSGNWLPQEMTLGRLLSEEQALTDISRPYPFYLAYALEGGPHSLGEPSAWQAEWKWDGIRGQIIKRAGELFVWSRGEELVTEKFPEYREMGELLPDGTVLDGEILPFTEGRPLSFQVLQTRIGRKNITRKILQEAPVVFIVYDLLEWEGRDIREQPLAERRALLEELLATTDLPALLVSPVIGFHSWEELAEVRESSRENNSEGIMLKRLASSYQAGRKRGDWWKWKIDPFSIDAVMIYAQKGHGRRSNLYTDYTFAVKDAEGRLVPFTKAYSGLTDREIAEVDTFVRRNGLEKFGPVRTVKPELVFEIAFEGIAASNRHKSGVALRFPRISRWRKDKQPSEINTLEDLRKMLEVYGK